MSEDLPVVTLVHGTRWKDRLLRRLPNWMMHSALRDALEQRQCDVRVFTWSGGNSHYARARAVRDLQTTLESHPDGSPQWVVAHSHGGNIAVRAADAVRRKNPNAGEIRVVSLATPFLHAQESPPSFQAGVFVALTLASGAIAAYNAFGAPAGLPSEVRWLSRVLAIGTAAHLALALRGFAWHGTFLGSASRKEFVSKLHAPETRANQLLAVRAAGDEASAILGFGQLMSKLGIGAAQSLAPITLASFATLGISTLASIREFNQGDSELGLRVLSYPYLMVSLSTLSALCVFGWDGPYLALYTRSSAEAIPPGEPSVWQLPPFASGSGTAHSRLYDEPRAAAEIASRIQ